MRVQLSRACALPSAVLLMFSATSAVSAGYTEINDVPHWESDHSEIVTDIYGGSFVRGTYDASDGSFTADSNGVSFSNGTITVARIDDFGVSTDPLNLVTGGPGVANDQVWNDGITKMTAEAVYSKEPGQSFGVFIDGDNNTPGGAEYQSLFSVSGTGSDPEGSAVFEISGDWRWGRDGTQPNHNYSSDPTEANADNGGEDQMVTYRVFGDEPEPDTTAWLLFWEGADGGRTFNDLVVRLYATVSAVPLPAPVSLALVGLGALVLLRRKMTH